MSARSYLFVPASRPDQLRKAIQSGADVVIADLEDAVPPDDKDGARERLAEWLADNPDAGVMIRVNAASSEWFVQDLAVCRMPAVVGIMLSKAERPADLTAAGLAAPGCSLLPLVETAAGFEQAPALARTKGVERLAFGSVDFQRDLGIEGDGEELLHFRSGLVLQSRLAGLLAPVDGVTIDIDDEALLSSEAARARRLGFGAKLCIHPLQVAVVHRAFRPHASEVAWARRVIRAAEHARGAVIALDGRRLDERMILQARTVFERSLADDVES